MKEAEDVLIYLAFVKRTEFFHSSSSISTVVSIIETQLRLFYVRFFIEERSHVVLKRQINQFGHFARNSKSP
jgi:hypothetical protein